MVNYYDRLTPGLTKDAKWSWTTEHLQADAKWSWTAEHLQTVSAIKDALTSSTTSTTLTHYDPTMPVSIACNASQVSIRAILFHNLPDNSEKPIAYALSKMSKAENNYAKSIRSTFNSTCI